MIDRWPELTPQERATELVRLVNVHLQAAGVPAVAPNATNTGNNAGQFDFPTWRMDIGLPALSAATMTQAEAADVVDTIYHEARHAEQWFRMAQLRAGEGRSATQIATELGIPRRIADLAKASPLDPHSMQGLIARGWYDSVYGSGSAHRDATLTALGSAHRPPGTYAAYRDLPEENDAWATGPMTAAGVTRGTPVPVPVDDLGDPTVPGSVPAVDGDRLAQALAALLGTRRTA